jgi:transposase
MAVVCGLDLHRREITFDALEVDSGKEWRGRVWQPDRDRFRRWLLEYMTRRANGGQVALAVEGCTGWRYMVEEIVAAGFTAHLAEPADTQEARGRKHRARRTTPTRASCGSCSWPGSCRLAGSHRRAFWSGGNGCGCTCR